MKRKILVAGGIVIVLIAVAAFVLLRFMSKPLYEPGRLRAGQGLHGSLAPPQQSGEERFWNVEGSIKLYHFSDGVGKNVLVVHGGPGNPIHSPLPGLTPLTNSFKFIYYDQRGCGKSTRPIDRFPSSNYFENMQTLDATLGIGAQLADIERIRRILGEEKLILLGHSFGGFLAALYAAEFPENVKALVLVAPADLLVMPAEGGDLMEEVRRALPDNIKPEYAAFLKNYFDFGSIFSKSDADLTSVNPQFAKYYRAAAHAKNISVPEETETGQTGGWMVDAMYFSMGRRHDYRPALRHVSAPVLVIHGENDLQPERASRLYCEVFPNSRFQAVNNTGHFPFNDHPEEFGDCG